MSFLSFSCQLLWLGFPILCWIEIAKVGIIVLFFVSKENFQSFAIGCVGFSYVAFYYAEVVSFYFYFLFLFGFLGLHPRHMEIPRLVVEWSCSHQPTPQPQQHRIWAASVTYTTAHCNSRSITHWVSEARDWTHILMDTSKIHYLCATMGTPVWPF